MTQTGEPAYWGDDHDEIRLLAEAVDLGVKGKDIADAVGPISLSSGNRFSNRDRAAVDQLMDARRERLALLAELEHLASCLGHDGAAKRRLADQKWSDAQISAALRTAHRYAKESRIDVRTEEEKNPPVSLAQVNYILDLLDRRRRSGEGGGFYGGPTDRQGISGLTYAEASTYIDSLTGDY